MSQLDLASRDGQLRPLAKPLSSSPPCALRVNSMPQRIPIDCATPALWSQPAKCNAVSRSPT